jgi:capsular polysaccharide biosynthesis protein
MQRRQAPDTGAPPKTVGPTPTEASPDQTPDGGGSWKRAKRSRSERPSGRIRNEAPPTAKQSRAAGAEVLTVESERHRIGLGPQALMRFGLYAVVIVLGASLAGYFFGALGGTVRAARSEVLYQLDAERPTGFLRQDRQLTTQLVTIRSRAVLAPIAAEYGLTFEDLSDKLDVSVAEESEVIGIEVHDASASRAKALVGAITRGYLARALPNGAAKARQYLEDRLRQLDEQGQQISARLAGAQSTAEQAANTATIQSLLSERVQLQSRLEDVTVEELRGPQVEEITKAYALDDPVSPRPWRAALSGALAGLLVAAIAITVLVRRELSAPHDE